MIVQHNIMALNAYNRLSGNNSAVSKNLEKLSSGYKINRAGDDAAGLAISEKMRAQITGLERASDNAQDGISLVQTAEGALTEVHSMLNRMVELATQSSNGTYDNTTDRANLQSEIESLQAEIDRIAKETNFNGINLLDGSLGAAATQKAETGADTTAVAAAFTVDFSALSAVTDGDDLEVGDITFTAAGGNGANAASIITELKGLIADGADVEFGGEVFTASWNGNVATFTQKTASDHAVDAGALQAGITNDGSASGATVARIRDGVAGEAATGAVTTLDFSGKTGAGVAGSTIEINGTIYEFVKTGGSATGTNQAVTVAENDDGATIAAALAGVAGATTTVDTEVYNIATDGAKVTLTSTTTGSGVKAIEVKQVGTGLNLQIGDTASQRISVKVDNMNSKSLGVDVSKVDIGSEEGATKAIKLIKDAINTVSSTRSDLGAIQNRLEYTVNNLATTTENLTSAESRIRDTDMAKEMMAYTKNNVLSQAAQAMLAQANQQPQQVLQLLR